MSKIALVSGVSGQDGVYLSHYLLNLGYTVYGIVRRVANRDYSLLDLLTFRFPNFHLVSGDVTDFSGILNLVNKYQPDEVYNLASQAHVAKSWDYPIATVEATGLGVLNFLEAIRQIKPDCKFFQASSSEMFGNNIQKRRDSTYVALNENSPLLASSPYAAAKILGYNLVNVYRHSYNLFASTAITFNHESQIRGIDYVTRKITHSLARIKYGKQDKIYLGNMNAKRDWGHAQSYIKAFHAILQHDKPDDFVIATQETHSVQEFFDLACKWFSLSSEDILVIDPKYQRPYDVEVLLGDASKARSQLGWHPEVNFERLVHLMCQYDDNLENSNIRLNSNQLEELIFRGEVYEPQR